MRSNDNFFALGGHSILAIRLVAQIKKKCSVEISIKDIFYSSNFNEVKKLVSENNVKAQNEIKKSTDKNVPLT